MAVYLTTNADRSFKSKKSGLAKAVAFRVGSIHFFLIFKFKFKFIDFEKIKFKFKFIDFKKLNSNSNSLTLKNQNSNSNSLTLQKSNSNSNSNSSITCERIQIQIQNSNSIQPPLFTPKIQREFCNLHLASRSLAVADVY